MSFLKNIRKASASARHVEEKLYEDVAKELGANIRREGLWAKAVGQSLGDETKIESLYIKLRVQSLKDEALLQAQSLKGEAQSLKDKAQAIKNKVAQGKGLYKTGLNYENRSLLPDYDGAVRCYIEAAELGNQDAKYKLSRMYSEGEGVERDLIRAHKWCSLYIVCTEEGAGLLGPRELEKIANKMKPIEIRTAQIMAEEWMRQHK